MKILSCGYLRLSENGKVYRVEKVQYKNGNTAFRFREDLGSKIGLVKFITTPPEVLDALQTSR